MDSILFSTPNNPRPDYYEAGYFNGFNSRKLRYAVFKTAEKNVKGTIVLLHGFNESIEKYYETIQHLLSAGFWVASFDWYGQGGSERILTDTNADYEYEFKNYQCDLDIFFKEIVLPETKTPYFILAHSMGGLILLSSISKLTNCIDKIVLVSPFLGMRFSVVQKLMIKISPLILNWTNLNKLPLINLVKDKLRKSWCHTSNQERYLRNQHIYEAYPELITKPPTIQWLLTMLKAIDHVTRRVYLTRVKTPIIILAAGRDAIVPLNILEDVSHNLYAGKIIPFYGARHEILHEAEIYRKPALAAILAFFITTS